MKTASEKKNKKKKKENSEAPVSEEKAKIKVEPVQDDRLLRLQADFENYRKRAIREKGEIYQKAHEDIFEELLSVLDHMDLALEAASEHEADDAFVEGFRLVSNQLREGLGKFGLEPIDAECEEFDHNWHEAISHVPSRDVRENVVIAQTRRGYRVGDRLLRAAQVVVSSGPPEDADNSSVDGEE